jgi:hypothetical protein
MRERGELDSDGNFKPGRGPERPSENCYCARCQQLRRVSDFCVCVWGGADGVCVCVWGGVGCLW